MKQMFKKIMSCEEARCLLSLLPPAVVLFVPLRYAPISPIQCPPASDKALPITSLKFRDMRTK